MHFSRGALRSSGPSSLVIIRVTSPHAVLSLAVMTSGCVAKVFLPPTGVAAMLESPATVGPASTAIGASMSSLGLLLGPTSTSGSLTFTRGLSERTDVRIAPIVQFFGDGAARIEGHDPRDSFAYGADLRIKTRPLETRHFAVYGGVGGSYNRFATYASVQCGLSLAYENDRLVPFVDVHAYAATPFHSRSLVYRASPASHAKVLQPSSTAGALLSGGFALKLGLASELRAAMTYGGVASADDRSPVLGIAASALYTF
jgi:hypothetical protein